MINLTLIYLTSSIKDHGRKQQSQKEEAEAVSKTSMSLRFELGFPNPTAPRRFVVSKAEAEV